MLLRAETFCVLAALLQSLSSIVDSLGPMSPLARWPNLLGSSSFNSLGAGLNLLPIVQTSLSARPWISGVKRPEPLCLKGGASDSRGRLERQSSGLSERLGSGRSLDGASNRRREASLEWGRSGSGPSRLHGLSNFALSSDGRIPYAVLSLALRSLEHYYEERWAKKIVLRGSATLTRMVRPEKFFQEASVSFHIWEREVLPNPSSRERPWDHRYPRILYNQNPSVFHLWIWWFSLIWSTYHREIHQQARNVNLL